MNLISASVAQLVDHINQAIENLPPAEITTDPVRAGNDAAAGKIVILYGAPEIDLQGNVTALTYKIAVVSPFQESRPEAINAIGNHVVNLMNHLGIDHAEASVVTGPQSDNHPAYILEYTHELLQEEY